MGALFILANMLVSFFLMYFAFSFITGTWTWFVSDDKHDRSSIRETYLFMGIIGGLLLFLLLVSASTAAKFMF